VLADQAVALANAVDARALAASPLKRALSFNFDTYLANDLLVKADRATMLHSLELRSPFLDTSLIEYKWILRRAFEDVLPSEILHRGKMGFGMPLGTWFRGGLREYVHDSLGPSAKTFQFLRRDYVETLLREHHAQEKDHEHQIWLLLTFERWLQTLPAWSRTGRVRPVHSGNDVASAR
jgi:asparagine synthase (glutamine-hydrolysing)